MNNDNSKLSSDKAQWRSDVLSFTKLLCCRGDFKRRSFTCNRLLLHCGISTFTEAKDLNGLQLTSNIKNYQTESLRFNMKWALMLWTENWQVSETKVTRRNSGLLWHQTDGRNLIRSAFRWNSRQKATKVFFLCECIRVKPLCKSIIRMKEALLSFTVFLFSGETHFQWECYGHFYASIKISIFKTVRSLDTTWNFAGSITRVSTHEHQHWEHCLCTQSLLKRSFLNNSR